MKTDEVRTLIEKSIERVLNKNQITNPIKVAYYKNKVLDFADAKLKDFDDLVDFVSDFIVMSSMYDFLSE